MFLLYLLVRRLQERQPVALEITSNTLAHFDKHGVSLHSSFNLDSAYVVPQDAWALSDSSEGDSPCPAFRMQPHMIHTSEPALHRWKWATKFSAFKYVMDVWPLDELRILLYVVSFSTS